jgi:hypothetical protein
MVTTYDGEWLPPTDITDATGQILVTRKHSTVPELLRYGLLSESQLATLTVVTTVRNPFDSVVSLWYKHAHTYQPLLSDPTSFVTSDPKIRASVIYAQDHSFGEWVQREFGELIHKPIHLYSRFLRGATVIMRFEQLHDDFYDFLRAQGVPRRSEAIPTLSVTEGRDPDYRIYYGRRTRRLVERAFRPDFDRFGYRF